MYSVYIKYRGGNASTRMHLQVEHKPGETLSHQTNIYMQPRYSHGLDAAGAPFGGRCTKIDCSDALSTGLFLKFFTLFYCFKHCDNYLKADVSSMSRCPDDEREKKYDDINVTCLTTLK